MLAAAAIIFFAYIGFDAVSTAAEETHNPNRDLPIGLIGSLLICTVIYITVVLTATGALHYSAAQRRDADRGVGIMRRRDQQLERHGVAF